MSQRDGLRYILRMRRLPATLSQIVRNVHSPQQNEVDNLDQSQMQPPTQFLRWAGSKRRLLPELTSYWCDSFTKYVEPFMGSACFFFHLQPPKAILGDINQSLVDTYSCVRDHPRAIYNRLKKLPKGKRVYYAIRSQDEASLAPLDRAARFIYLNRYCFNGLYRTNLLGKFNVPYSASRTGQLPTLTELKSVSVALENVSLVCGDFEATITSIDENTFVYLDPPFAVSNRRIFRQYDPNSFGLLDLDRLQSALESIDRSKGKFLVSYAMCADASKKLTSWNVRRVSVSRNISGFAKHRRRAVELLISNFEPSSH